MKKIVSVLLTLAMMFTLLPFSVFAADDTITVFVSISQKGSFVTGKDATPVALVPVELSGKDGYSLDDALKATHDICYDGGASLGYSSAYSTLGLGITKLWGDESGLFGYQLNKGTVSVRDLTQTISHGDCIDAYIYQSSWPNNEAYTFFEESFADISFGESVTLTLTQSGYDADWNTIFTPVSDAIITINGEETEYTTNHEGVTTIVFDIPGTYLVSAKKQAEESNVTAITAPVCQITVGPDASITVPENTTLFVGQKDGPHFVPFTEISPSLMIENMDSTTYYYDLADEGSYNLRITGEDFITYATSFTKTKDFNLVITEETLRVKGKDKFSTERDVTANECCNVADIFLNINPQGHLKLSGVGDTYQVIPLRNWQTTDNTSVNLFFTEPDYHYTILDETGSPCDSVVSVSDDGLLTAKGQGIAIVLVTYDALQVPSAYGGPFFGAIWPENTGVFVVSVGINDGNIRTGMTLNKGKNTSEMKLSGDAIDAEHDVIYFLGEKGVYTFTPETEGCSVSVSNPTIGSAMTFHGFENVPANEDGSFSVPLTEGRNIVRIEKNGDIAFQVITAKKLTVTINNGNEVHPGDSINIVFDTLYHPSNKLAGIYNMSALPVYTDVSAYENELIGGLSSQYEFASSSDAQTVCNVLKETESWGMIGYEKDSSLMIPEDYTEDSFTLSGGMLYTCGFGDACGSHRNITLTDGRAPNLNADARMVWLGRLPDIQISVTESKKESSSNNGGFGGGGTIGNTIVDPNSSSTESNTSANDTSASISFADVPADAWYSEAIKAITAKGIMNGTGSNFEPDSNMTRAMLVTVLWRMEGKPATGLQASFSDVSAEEWYTDAVLWAAENAIVKGINDSAFAPDALITREQLAVILHRYAAYKGKDTNILNGLSGYTDAEAISDWAISALQWATAQGLIKGTSETTLSPLDHATRAEVAQLFYRILERADFE